MIAKPKKERRAHHHKDSILQNEKYCFICKTTQNLHNHHIFGGPNRKISDKHGFTVWLCAEHHNMSNYSAHFDKDIDNKLKTECQLKYEESHSRDDFKKLIGRNYL